VPACPVGGGSVLDAGNEAFREPPQNVAPAVLASHVQRANHHLGPIDRDVSSRIFRQGYEFLEPPVPGRELALGLNFVGFQDTPKRVFFTNSGAEALEALGTCVALRPKEPWGYSARGLTLGLVKRYAKVERDRRMI
jgi:hypothetical protein